MDVREISRGYTTRCNRIAVLNTIGTMAAYFGMLGLAIRYANTWYLLVPFSIAVAFAAIRLYMLQHDCGHGSLFTTRRLNDAAGRLMAPFTFAPYNATKYNHNQHHTHIGNLDHRDAGDIYTMTLAEYRAAPIWKQLGYRVYRSPLILFCIGPVFVYIIQYRFPKNSIKTGIWDVMITNVAIGLYLWSLYALFGLTALGVLGGCIVIGGFIGAMIPYIQHNFEDMYWERKPDHDFSVAALRSSAVLDFGRVYNFLTVNIAYHDLHHLNANIPCYRLGECFEAVEHLLDSRKIGFIEGMGCLRWKLWDEDVNKMVTFPPLRISLGQRAGGADHGLAAEIAVQNVGQSD